MSEANAAKPAASTRLVLVASLVGTTIEFFDFYIYATAAVLVFPRLFFPAADPASAVLQSFATFALAFFARPIGSAVFGHYGDRIGRKATLVAALLTMGLSTIAIGLLPTYASVGRLAPAILALCRFGQGLGLGGEWGGAVLLVSESSPPGRRALHGMFPQLGAPLGFIGASGIFLLLGRWTSEQEFLEWAWRLPFLLSSLLVFVGLYVRLRLDETPEFWRVRASHAQERVPLLRVLARHRRELVTGMFAGVTPFAVFYVMTVFSLGWGTGQLHLSRPSLLGAQLLAMLFLAAGIALSAALSERVGCRRVLACTCLAVMGFGLVYPSLFGSGDLPAVTLALSLGLLLMGFTFGPFGTAMSELFPTSVRYTGTSLAFNLAGILGASLAPYASTWLASHYGLEAVGAYISVAGMVSLVALLAMPAQAGGQARAAPLARRA